MYTAGLERHSQQLASEWSPAAISQYTWHKPVPSASATHRSMQSIVDFALRGARDSMEKVLETARQVGTLADLGRWGFVMDVVVKLRGTDVEMQFVEINPFGAVSGCGSCLFHWIRDAEQLYGLTGKIEICVATDERGD